MEYVEGGDARKLGQAGDNGGKLPKGGGSGVGAGGCLEVCWGGLMVLGLKPFLFFFFLACLPVVHHTAGGGEFGWWIRPLEDVGRSALVVRAGVWWVFREDTIVKSWFPFFFFFFFLLSTICRGIGIFRLLLSDVQCSEPPTPTSPLGLDGGWKMGWGLEDGMGRNNGDLSSLHWAFRGLWARREKRRRKWWWRKAAAVCRREGRTRK